MDARFAGEDVDRTVASETAWPTRVEGTGAWTRADLDRDSGWLHDFDPAWSQEIDAALVRMREQRVTLDDITPAHLDCPQLIAFLREFMHRDVAGRGVGLIRGLPRERYTDEELGWLFWGLGQHLGTGVSQNAQGDRLGHVRSRELDYDGLNVRGYQTSHALEFHCDPSDVVGLLCLRQAPSGGESAVVSGLSIYNTVMAEHPEYLPVLERGFVYDRRGEEAHYQSPVSEPVPVFGLAGGQVSIRYVRKSIETGMAKLGREFTSEEARVLDYLDELTRRPDLVKRMRLEPGDIQFVNNYTVLHARTGYKDHSEPALRRHLLRLWLKVPGLRSLDRRFIEYDAGTGWSRREGIRPPQAPPPNAEVDPPPSMPM
jgi:hypothetical protein